VKENPTQERDNIAMQNAYELLLINGVTVPYAMDVINCLINLIKLKHCYE
jgi:hypothetical protein